MSEDEEISNDFKFAPSKVVPFSRQSKSQFALSVDRAFDSGGKGFHSLCSRAEMMHNDAYLDTLATYVIGASKASNQQRLALKLLEPFQLPPSRLKRVVRFRFQIPSLSCSGG